MTIVYRLRRTSKFDLCDESEFCYNNENVDGNDRFSNKSMHFTYEEVVKTKARLESFYGNDHSYEIIETEENKENV